MTPKSLSSSATCTCTTQTRLKLTHAWYLSPRWRDLRRALWFHKPAWSGEPSRCFPRSLPRVLSFRAEHSPTLSTVSSSWPCQVRLVADSGLFGVIGVLRNVTSNRHMAPVCRWGTRAPRSRARPGPWGSSPLLGFHHVSASLLCTLQHLFCLCRECVAQGPEGWRQPASAWPAGDSI